MPPFEPAPEQPYSAVRFQMPPASSKSRRDRTSFRSCRGRVGTRRTGSELGPSKRGKLLVPPLHASLNYSESANPVPILKD